MPEQEPQQSTPNLFIFEVFVWLLVTYFAAHCASNTTELVQLLRPPTRGTMATFFGRVKEGVAFCPMLCLLFLGLQLQILHIAGVDARPPNWCIFTEHMVVYATVLVIFVGAVDVASTFLLGAGCQASFVIHSICMTLQFTLACVLYMCAFLLCIVLVCMTGERNSPAAFIPVKKARPVPFG